MTVRVCDICMGHGQDLRAAVVRCAKFPSATTVGATSGDYLEVLRGDLCKDCQTLMTNGQWEELGKKATILSEEFEARIKKTVSELRAGK